MRRKPLKRKCPLCGALHGDIILDLHYAMFDGCPLDSEFGMVACGRCGFVFFDTSSNYNDLHQYYKNCLFYNNGEKQVQMDSVEHNAPANERFVRTAECVVAHQSNRAACVVDIGANNGEQLIELQRLGYKNLCGLDMRQSSVARMTACGLEAYLGSAEKLPENIQKADVCLMSHTLEHLLNPVRVLTNVRPLLKDNGILYVEVPDAAEYPIDDLAQWYKFMFHEHINHFDMHHLNALATACGFEAIETGHKMIAHRERRMTTENKVHCIYGLYKKTKANGSGVASSFNLRTSLLNRTRSVDFDPGNCMEKLVRSESRVFLWGLSQYAQLMLGSTHLNDIRNLQLIDRDPFKQTQAINGTSILPPSTLTNIGSDSVVLLSDQQAAPSMKHFLLQHGFEGKTHILGHGAAGM